MELFRAVCANDLEGIVAKPKDGPYTPEETSWVKIKTGITVRPRAATNSSKGWRHERKVATAAHDG